jgi:two-component system response regulator PilR (NtrC family)
MPEVVQDPEPKDPSTDSIPRSVLIVDDDENLSSALFALLSETGYVTHVADDGAKALASLEKDFFDVVLLDLNLPRVGGLDVLSMGRGLQTDARFILMTAFGGVADAVEAMKLGAFDYLTKPFRTDELLLVIDRALEDIDLRRELSRLKARTAGGARGRIIGRSPEMMRVFRLIERVAPTRTTVLITGETGTGKELVAEAIHEASGRSAGPMVAVNCSALPETLLESELFGHEKGAFTGAVQSKKGLFEEASGGTLFLDEASTMGEAVQVKLLRALQERQVHRVGGRHSIPVDFRLIVATNADLEEMVRAGRFREDLFYRLAVFPIHVPPLRERRGDVPLLAAHFRSAFARDNDVEPPELRPETLRGMMEYAWPGNVRELENFVERAMIMHAGAGSIPFGFGPAADSGVDGLLVARGVDAAWTLARMEEEYVLAVLDAHDGNRTKAAEALGIDRRTLTRKLGRYREREAGEPAHDA